MNGLAEHQPGEPAPVAGTYGELNVFGTPTGRTVRAGQGETLPDLPRGCVWQITAIDAPGPEAP